MILGDTLTRRITTVDPSTGLDSDAQVIPIGYIYENDVSTPMVYTGVISELTSPSSSGCYKWVIEILSVNGFRTGNQYSLVLGVQFNGVVRYHNLFSFTVDEDILSELQDEAFGKWILDKDLNTLTLYKSDGTTVLRTFNLGVATGNVPAYISRTPA